MKPKDRPFALLCALLALAFIAGYAHSCAQRVEVRR